MERSILLDTLHGKKTQRPPVWYMRQAGRILPSYNALKEKYTFWQLMKDPKLGAKVTLMPVQDLGVDAAILFSDILVIPYALGMGLEFTDEGPVFEKPLSTLSNPASICKPDAAKLEYIYKVIDEINIQKPENISLIGFCGAPLTVLLYMLQGLGSKSDFPAATQFIYNNKKQTIQLIDVITDLSIEYMKGQKQHGIDVFQLFDTHAGIIPFSLYKELFFPSIAKIARVARELSLPFIFFPKGIGCGLSEITPEYADFVSIDWQTSLKKAREIIHKDIGLQGNIDPKLLFAPQEEIISTLETYLEFGKKNNNWIFNLGHGFMPGMSFENAKLMTDWVKTVDWGRE